MFLLRCCIFLTLLSCGLPPVSGQCPYTFPDNPDCSSGGTVSQNSSFFSGDTGAYCQPMDTVSNVSMEGGVLLVCGELTIDGLSFNSGEITVATYGKLVILGDVTFNNDCKLTNYGTVEVHDNIEFQNNDNFIFNVKKDAVLKVLGKVEFAQNASQAGYIVNKGYFQANTMMLQDGANDVCLEDSSYMRFTDLEYDIQNVDTVFRYQSVASGEATVHYSGNAFLSNFSSKSFAPDSQVTVCKAATATESGQGDWGTAEVQVNCSAEAPPDSQSGPHTTCFSILPVELTAFSAEKAGSDILLHWRTASEVNSDHFKVVRSFNGDAPYSIGQVMAAGNSSLPNSYHYRDECNSCPEEGGIYYQLLQVDKNGEREVSQPVAVHRQMSPENRLKLYPVPAGRELHIKGHPPPGSDHLHIAVFSTHGVRAFEKKLPLSDGNLRTTLDVSSLTPGRFLLYVYDEGHHKIKSLPFVKQ